MKELKTAFTKLNLSGQTDDTSATIGKRYARNDELGIPFAITIDQETFRDQSVTLRERNSCGQIRVPVSEVVEVIGGLFKGESFATAAKRFTMVENKAVDAVGVAVLAGS